MNYEKCGGAFGKDKSGRMRLLIHIFSCWYPPPTFIYLFFFFFGSLTTKKDGVDLVCITIDPPPANLVTNGCVIT